MAYTPSGDTRTVTTTAQVLATDGVILANAASGGFAVTLPDVASVAKQTFFIKKIDATGNIVTVSGNGANIDGSAQQTLDAQWESILVVSTGSAYYIL